MNIMLKSATSATTKRDGRDSFMKTAGFYTLGIINAFVNLQTWRSYSYVAENRRNLQGKAKCSPDYILRRQDDHILSRRLLSQSVTVTMPIGEGLSIIPLHCVIERYVPMPWSKQQSTWFFENER
jgi:hypothetical protein